MDTLNQYQELLEILMDQFGIKNQTELGRFFYSAIGEENKTRQTESSKGAKFLNDPSMTDILMLAGLFGVHYKKLIKGDRSALNFVVGNGNIIGDNNHNSNAKEILSPREFMALKEKEREDYLRFLELTNNNYGNKKI